MNKSVNFFEKKILHGNLLVLFPFDFLIFIEGWVAI